MPDATTNEYTGLGLGYLGEATGAIVNEEINGEFTLTLSYPVTGRRYDDIRLGRLIVCRPNPYDKPQAFEITTISIPINNIITVDAHHISYRQSRYPVKSLDTRTGLLNRANSVVLQTEDKNRLQEVIEEGVEYLVNYVEDIKNIFTGDSDDNNATITLETGYTHQATLVGGQVIKWVAEFFTFRPNEYKYVVNGQVVPLSLQVSGKTAIFTTPGDGTLYWIMTPGYSTSVTYLYRTQTLSKILDILSKNMMDVTSETSTGMTNVSPFKIHIGWSSSNTDPDINPDIDPYNLVKEMAIEEDKPMTLRAALGQKLTEKYKIEYKFDNYDIWVYGKKGRGRRYEDTGFQIAYGKNMTDLTKKIGDKANEEYTHVYPFWYSPKTNVIKHLKPSNNTTHGYDKFVPIDYGDNKVRPQNIYLYDLSSEFALMPTGEEMAEKTEIFIRKNDMNVSKVSTKVSFEDLSKYPEFGETMKALYEVQLGDDVRVIVPDKNIDDIVQCVKTEYDVLKDKYLSIELGEPSYGVAATINSQRIAAKKNQSQATFISANLTKSAAGIAKGYVGSSVISLSDNPISGLPFDQDGYPNEIVIANLTPEHQSITDPEVSMWRWNHYGLMFVTGGWREIQSGSVPPVAITNDGKINADMILTGSISVGSGDSAVFKIEKDYDHQGHDKFYMNIKDNHNNSMLYIDSSQNVFTINATAITTGELYLTGDFHIKDSNGVTRSIIPTVTDAAGDNFYIDNNYIKLTNIDANNIVTGTLAVREVRSGGHTAATSAELFDNISWPAEDHPNTYAKVSNETSITPTGIQNGRWYRSSATFEVIADLGDYAWEEVGTAPYKYWRMTTQLPDIYTDYTTTTIPSLYVYGYKTVAQTAWSSRSDYQCSLLPEGTGKRLVIDNPELRGKTAAYVKNYFTGTKVYYKVVSAAERLTYKWYPNDDYWYWTHFGTTYPNASTGLIDINTRIGSFYVSGNTIFQGLPGRESKFNENGVFLSTGIAAAYTIGTGVNVRGWCLGIGGKFGVTIEGNLYASNAYIQGKIDADEGYVGGWIIRKGSLTRDEGQYGASETGSGLLTGRYELYNSTDSASIGNIRFYAGKPLNQAIVETGSATTFFEFQELATANYKSAKLFITDNGYFIGRSLIIRDSYNEDSTGHHINLRHNEVFYSSQHRATWLNIIDTVNNMTSDARIKRDIKPLSDKYDILFDTLAPKSYKYVAGDSDRVHTGFIAQDVLDAIYTAGLTTKEFAAFIVENPGTENEIMRLRKDEFVSLNTWQIQKLKQKVPNPPDEDGDYVLKCSIVNGVKTYSWAAM